MNYDNCLHNDDLIPVAEYEGIVLYHINYEQARERDRAEIRRLISINRKNEENKND